MGDVRPQLTDGPRVPESVFMNTIWGGLSTSFVFVAIRFYSRLREPPQLFWEDVLVAFAWLLTLGTAIVWRFVADEMYIYLNVRAGILWPPPADLSDRIKDFITGNLIVLVFFYTCLWAVKISFLLFFRRLGRNVSKQNYIWWPILTVNLATYVVCIGTMQFNCLTGSLEHISAECSSTYEMEMQLKTMKLGCALDVFTNFLIIIIPMHMLWKVRLHWTRKLVLGGIFSLVIITIAFAIIRVVLVAMLGNQADISWFHLWSIIEEYIAIIVACLSSFPQLFTQSNRAIRNAFTPSDRSQHMRKRPRQHDILLSDLTSAPDHNFIYTRAPDTESNHSPLYPASTASQGLIREPSVPEPTVLPWSRHGIHRI